MNAKKRIENLKQKHGVGKKKIVVLSESDSDFKSRLKDEEATSNPGDVIIIVRSFTAVGRKRFNRF